MYSCILYPCFDNFFTASIFVDCTVQVCERVCLFQWLSFQCDGVVVLCVGFHNLCLASVDVES
ncbi:hypothetical protein NP493_97g05034 [Ridgeia piscesae]|uniref:Uncharacterized protein n=1 Tax=Ridgeia piscesae TaxID=27915 RepID=A0AAD9UHR1_RIDPI|nr:hypothetical protein NP493_97g05034 [Ridgeia piscesae]